MGAGYSNLLSGDVPLSMQTPWKWATHTEDEVGWKRPASWLWSEVALVTECYFIPMMSLLEAVCRLCCQIQWWVWTEVDKLMYFTMTKVLKHDCSFIPMKAVQRGYIPKKSYLANVWIKAAVGRILWGFLFLFWYEIHNTLLSYE